MKLRDLNNDWDGEGAPAPDGDVLGLAQGLFEKILSTVGECPKRPSIIPSRAGGILVEWKAENLLLDIHIVSRDQAEYAFTDRISKKRESGKLSKHFALPPRFVELVEGFAEGTQ